MISNIFSGISQKSQELFEQWKYLLLQEKCRLCKRMIHPLIEKMDFVAYGPPAKYLIAHKQVVSDVICQFCLPNLASCQAVLNKHYFNINGESFDETEALLVASAAMFVEPVQSLIYRLKYSEDVLLAKDLACLMYKAWQLLENEVLYTQGDAICLVPIPLHKKRLHERGFNQAEILATHLGCLLSLKVETKLISRIKNTISQQKLSKVERAKNVVGAFKALKPDILKGKKVILVDDVSTSGATLIECAKAVMAGGAHSVYALTIAFVP
jgi:ComF family protein